jgi:signal transduction histidine kinase
LVFDVTDQGIGIPADEQPRLFENFFRASNVGQAHGTGLGLAIVKRAVGLHGGSVAVDSVVGQGSVFRLVIPLSQRVDIEIFVDTQI